MVKTNKETNLLEKSISRRTFIKGAGIATGAVVGGIALTSAAEPVVTEDPLPYKTLDTKDVLIRGHEGYYVGGCCYGAYYAIMSALRDLIGGPYEDVQYRTMRYGGAGIAGWGTICGAENGACAAIATVVPNKDISKVCNELLYWYSNAQLPTDEANKIGAAGNYTRTTKEYPAIDLPQSVASSPLCHASVANWCKASGIAENDKKRLERCARVTGDAAAKAAELLNDYFAGTIKYVAAYSPMQESCFRCHSGTVGKPKMDCLSCHDGHMDY
ncbi:MAG: hypothetical protein BKP49_05380 [Treponema sp. CETP13]|nr:MAG: hypothetical protein BKP49_05380 [Treponema sp. CETP13]